MYQVLLDKNMADDKEALFARVFPDGAYTPQDLRLVMSYLQKLVDQFLALEQWQNTPGAVESAAVTVPLGWCESCWRDDRRHEPIGSRPGGTAPYYAKMCGWCGRFKAAHRRLPTVEQIRKYHDRKHHDR